MRCNNRNSCKDILYANFNQDYSCVAVATREAVKIFHCDSHTCCFEDKCGAISFIEMLFSSSLLAMVGAGEQPALSPRRLRLVNTINHTCIANLSFPSSVLAARLSRKRLVVVLERKTMIYDLSTLELLETIDTAPNPRGVSALSQNDGNKCFYAYPGSATAGSIRPPRPCFTPPIVYDCHGLQVMCELRAHTTPLVALAFSPDGSMLASASEKGTIIRVHHIYQAAKLFTFRRGSYPATIQSMCFSPPSLSVPLLCVSSTTGTVHVFRLRDPPPSRHHGVPVRSSLLLLHALCADPSGAVSLEPVHLYPPSCSCCMLWADPSGAVSLEPIRLPAEAAGTPALCALVPTQTTVASAAEGGLGSRTDGAAAASSAATTGLGLATGCGGTGAVNAAVRARVLRAASHKDRGKSGIMELSCMALFPSV
ncbi:hypothetical protein CYMTET_25963 [Cymbomonas tetramitiformis]|uniref:Uncharacterized protein n=1 Tax=Cymbomonas tetramitiformis TaxID=36881 RepID=A0AAE0FTJ5_9CHLO|nr:hypothetical protein CYMTET_25963 [Cymbomonas tetramitiformis]